jgi:hypothetical protein
MTVAPHGSGRDLEPVGGWSRYAELARRLDEVRSEEIARTAGMREAVAEMSAHADDLEARLRGQGGMLTRLATSLRLRPPRFDPVVPEGPVDPATALARLAGIIDRGDAEADRAGSRGERAGLMPALGPGARSWVVYLVATLLVLIVQLPLIRGNVPNYSLAVILVIPGVGFGVAFLLLRFGGRSRVDLRAPEVPARLGFLLCFVIGPVVQLIALLRGATKP